MNFMFLQLLKKSTDFLKSNLDYGCCIGRCVGFKSTKNYLNLWPEKIIQAKHLVNHNKSLSRNELSLKKLYTKHSICSSPSQKVLNLVQKYLKI